MKAPLALVAYVLAIALSATTAHAAKQREVSGLSAHVLTFWRSVARCEEHSDWAQRGTTYVSGLGIWYGNWNRWAPAVGVTGPAYLATPYDQMRVADYGYRTERAYWGCFRTTGYPPVR